MEDREKKIPRTITFNFRGDICDVATLIHIYSDILDVKANSKASFVRIAVSDYCSVLLSSFPKAKKFSNTEEALRFLHQRNLMNEGDEDLLLRKSRLDKIVTEDRDLVSDIVLPESIATPLVGEEVKKRAKELEEGGKE